MKHRNAGLLLLAGALAASAAQSQQTPATPRVRTNVVVASELAKVTVSMRGTATYLSVDANNADVRATLSDMATKAALKLVLDPSARGPITGAVSAQPADSAIAEVAKLAGLSVKKIIVPDASAASVTADFGGRYVDTLTTLPIGTLISDATTGKTLVISAAAPTAPTGTIVYFVHGRMAPGGMRQRPPRTGAPGANAPGGQPPQPGQPNQDFVSSAAKSLQSMPLQQRFDSLRALQQSLRDSMTPEEQDQMRQTFGGRGGFGGGRRGGGNNGGGGGQGGQNNG